MFILNLEESHIFFGSWDWYHIPNGKTYSEQVWFARETLVVDAGIKLPYVPNNPVSGRSHDLMYGDIYV